MRQSRDTGIKITSLLRVMTMYNPRFKIINQTANTLTVIERAREFLEAATLNL